MKIAFPRVEFLNFFAQVLLYGNYELVSTLFPIDFSASQPFLFSS
jgi:hypothetical protein